MTIACLGGKYAADIYKYLSMALDKSIQHSRYDMPRSALQLFAKHACQWDRCIIDEYKVIADTVPSLMSVILCLRSGGVEVLAYWSAISFFQTKLQSI